MSVYDVPLTIPTMRAWKVRLRPLRRDDAPPHAMRRQRAQACSGRDSGRVRVT